MTGLARQRRPVSLSVTSSERVRAALDATPHVLRARPGDLIAGVDDRGQVKARVCGTGGHGPTPPSFRGRLEAAALTGEIRESLAEVLVPRMFAGLTVMMAVVAVAALLGGAFVGFAICAPAAAAFAVLAWALGGQRGSTFHEGSEQLLRALAALG